MDPLDTLAVRFHFGGEFLNDGKKTHYCGGNEAMSDIDRDKISLPELVGHLRDHCVVKEGMLMHWLFPGKELENGLRVLVDDKACQYMSDCITDGGVAEIYVEDEPTEMEEDEDGGEANASDFEDELVDMADGGTETDDGEPACDEIEEVQTDQLVCMKARSESREEIERQIKQLTNFYRSPTKKGKEVCESSGKSSKDGTGHRDGSESSEDSDYVPGDACSSEEDEEANKILKRFKTFKKGLRSGGLASLDDVEVSGRAPKQSEIEVPIEGYDTPYADSDDEDSVEEVDSDGQLRKKKDHYKRFKGSDEVPKFELGMKFSEKKEFKDAIVRYCLHERKVVRFVKDDPKRVRARCDWAHCPWVCLCSRNSRSESWQIATFNNEHTCPPRRDNKHVTARRIAEKYEKFIISNPSWNFAQMKSTVQEEMFADVSISKLKRAKAIVMQKVYDASKGQYERLYDYQLELLRSNVGSTIVIHKQPDVEPPTFWRMYICLDACKKGFMAGCRKVVGLDGCFFKGATNGELLQAVGRDANNQMYPIAWAVVDKENNVNWDWFCDLLFRDIQVGDGRNWVFISDQQKVCVASNF